MSNLNFRDTPREEYFYQLGRLEELRLAKHPATQAQESVVRNAAAQIPDEPETYYGN